MRPSPAKGIIIGSAICAAFYSIMALPRIAVTPSNGETYSLWYMGDVIDTGLPREVCLAMLPTSERFACVVDGRQRGG